MKMKKLISILITISILFSAVNISFAEEKEYYNLELTKVNQKLLQAEDMTLDENITKVEENENAFNGKQVRMLSGNGEAISFNVSPAKIPQIVFWMRYSAENLSSNSVTFYLDGKKQVCELPVTGKDKFQWIKIGAVNFPGKRTHTLKLRIHPKESNIIADAFYITDDGTYYPSNNEIDFAFKYEMLSQDNEGLAPSGIKPIEGHPRVMFTKDDIPRLKESLYAPENAEAYKEWQKLLKSELTGKLNPNVTGLSSNKDVNVNAVIEAFAFSYAITGNEEHGRRAISVLKEMLDSFIFVPGEPYHEVVFNIYLGAVVYDWCFDLLTEEDKKFIVYYCQRQIQDMGTSAYGDGYPYLFKTRGVVSSTLTITNPHHGPLAFSIAIYDEYPELFDYLSSVEVHLFRPAGNYIIEGGAHPSGSSYGMSRMYGMYYAHYLLKIACGGFELYNEEKLVDMSLAWIYDKNPDGFRYRYGDQAVYTTAETDYASHSKDTAAHMIAASLADDEYKKSVIKQFVFQENANLGGFIYWQEVVTPVSVFVFNDLSVPAQSYKGLPLTRYFPEPMGRMIAKTGWSSGRDSKDATVVMNIKTEIVTNHGHPDAGTFQIFYKGLVAPDLSHYNLIYPPNYPGHNTQTISHNGLLILDPNEYDYGTGYNSGGQKVITTPAGISFPTNIEDHIRRLDEFTTGEIIGMEYGPDKFFPEYSYIAGDITKAYSDKVSEVRRSMMFMPTENEEYPAVFFVMDKIDAKKSSFKKTYLLQAFEEPEVNNENTVTLNTATNSYNGSAVNQTVYPEVNIEAIGGPGKAWFVNGENLVPRGQENNSTAIGWGRVEISPKEEKNLDYLMNVIYVKDADNKAEIEKAELIDTEELLGAKIFNKVSLFAKSSERLTDEFSFKVEGEGKVDIAITGIARGEWEINVNGNRIGTQISTEKGGMIYFNADCGEVKVKKVSEKSDKVFTENAFQGNLASDVEFKYNGRLRYSKTPLTVMNGTCYIPIETLFNVINGETTYSEDGKTATGIIGGTKVSVTEGSSEVELIIGNKDVSFNNTHPIVSINGSLMLPARKVVESVGGIVNWGTYPPSLKVSLDEDVLSVIGEIPIVDSTMTTEHEAAENAYMTYDKNRDTIWAGGGDGAWIIWEFDDSYTIRSFTFDANKSMSDRKYLFELYYSLNGKDWTLFYDGSSPGDGSKLYHNLEAPVKAKYVKYIGRKNTNTIWNNVAEVMFSTELLDLSKYGGKK